MLAYMGYKRGHALLTSDLVYSVFHLPKYLPTALHSRTWNHSYAATNQATVNLETVHQLQCVHPLILVRSVLDRNIKLTSSIQPQYATSPTPPSTASGRSGH